MKNANNFILNQFEDGSGEKIDLTAPRNGKKIGEVTLSKYEDVGKIVKKIKDAQIEWNSRTFKSRTELIFRFRENLQKYRKEIVELIVLENGKLEEEAHAEVSKAIELCEFAISIPSLITGRTEMVSTGVEVKEIYEGVGVVCSITPFNFPLMVPMWTIPTTLVLGNAMILKPSEKTPLTSLKIASILYESGCPEGVFNVIQGGSDVVEALCENEMVDAITFVGSTPVAKIVYRKATSELKRALTLGGAKNHIIVTEEVNPKITASEIISAAFGMSGQRCMAASVLLVVGENRKVVNELVKQAGNLICGESISPLITEDAVKSIENYLTETNGNILVDGRFSKNVGNPSGYYIGPSIIEYEKYSDIPFEEVFGPTLEIVYCQTLEEAYIYQNTSPYANGATIFTDKGIYAQEAISNLSSGMIGVNIGVPVPREPFSFGGLKSSKYGVGDITGFNSIPFLTKMKKVTTKWNSNHKKDWTS